MTLLVAASLLQPGPAGPASGDGWGAARALTAAACVLAVTALLAWLARRGSLSVFRRNASAIRVETAAALGDRRTLVIVSVEGRRLLLGVTAAQVSLLAELPPAAAGFDRSLDRSLGGSRPV